MKKILIILLSSFLFAGITHAQQAPTSSVKDTSKIDTYYYEGSTIEFAEGADMTKYEPINPNTEFQLKDGNVEVTTILRLDKPFKTKGLIVDIYDDNDDLYDSFNFDIDEKWDFASFKMNFDVAGHYFIDIYSSDEVFINSAELDIK